MKFVTVRDLRNKSSQIRKYLSEESDIVLTSNGKPFAILTPVSEESWDKSITISRSIRAENAVNSMQKQSIKTGANYLSFNEINAEIEAVRKKRK